MNVLLRAQLIQVGPELYITMHLVRSRACLVRPGPSLRVETKARVWHLGAECECHLDMLGLRVLPASYGVGLIVPCILGHLHAMCWQAVAAAAVSQGLVDHAICM